MIVGLSVVTPSLLLSFLLICSQTLLSLRSKESKRHMFVRNKNTCVREECSKKDSVNVNVKKNGNRICNWLRCRT